MREKMSFLLRTTQPAVPENLAGQEPPAATTHSAVKSAVTLEGLIADDPFAQGEGGDRVGVGVEGESGGNVGSSEKNEVPIVENHLDVAEDEGWITIPYKELPASWNDAPDIASFRSLDRSFVFPGEQVHILACLSASNEDKEVITPFRVAAAMSKNGILGHNVEQPSESNGTGYNPIKVAEKNSMNRVSAPQNIQQNEKAQVAISTSESILRMEDHRKQTEAQLEIFKNSHFFVRIAESNEALWSKRSAHQPSVASETVGDKVIGNEAGARYTSKTDTHLNAFIDKGSFDASVSGGVARNAIKCCSLSNGDIVVILQVTVGTNYLKDPILEVLQFEKFQDRNLTSLNPDLESLNQDDPCRDLLKWLLPLDHTLPPLTHPLSPPSLSSNASIRSASHKPTFSSSSGSQLFSFSNFRSYSMSSLPQNTVSPPVVTSNSKPIFDLVDRDRFFNQKPFKSQESSGNEGLLSFRGVPLEPERFSVHCGLEGVYIPGRRWRRKLEIIQPVEIHSFSADCNTEDLLCVQIKNVAPPHIPDIILYLDAITVVFEEAPKGGPPISLPIACIEAGDDHCLPNLVLRRNEEHSFILKPATSMWRNTKSHKERSSQASSHSHTGGAMKILQLPSKINVGKGTSSNGDQYAVLVSCRCNYTESRLFFKRLTSWRPRVTRDLMISVASEMSEQTLRPNGGLTQLPVQVLTLQASNLTSEDLTLTVLAPASFISPPSVVSLNSTPSTPVSPFVGFSEFAGRMSEERRNNGLQRLSSMPHVSENHTEKTGGEARAVSFDEHKIPISDVIPNAGLGCTHLWLQSAVPLGCVPSQSTATVKLELLPLTDGIITLDTLQINVKEKGLHIARYYSLEVILTLILFQDTTNKRLRDAQRRSFQNLQQELRIV
ncbi:hypothetical protein GIB67_030230 [Kingdonia uniflora]|uniref:Uncharacterized protein n=1 Tax=Kingdonia uniflora TaxID=39325 RepID=A0A7J7MN26_9MAGN|nr:hypothetical protein GIB67_030230 [Kingdonia uniflora]